MPLFEPPGGNFYTARDRANLRRFNLWLFASMVAYLGATATLRWRATTPVAFAWLAAALAFALGMQATRSYLTFLRQADELLRKIQTEALAMGFGAGVAFSLLYPVLEKLGAPELHGQATAPLMMICSALGLWLGMRRYCGRGGA